MIDRPMSRSFEGYAIVAPRFSARDAHEVALEHFGLAGDAAELASHQDRNFLITASDGRRAVLKVANPSFGRGALELQNAAMTHVAGASLGFATPVPLPARDGRGIVTVERAGAQVDVRLLTYLEGTPLSEAAHLSAETRRAVGSIAGRLAAALAGFEHPAADRVLQWDVRRARAVVDGLVEHVRDPGRRALVERAMAVHDAGLARVRDGLRMQVIHGDVTRYNLLGRRDPAGRLAPCGLIDFGDTLRSYRVGELAVAVAAVAGASEDPVVAIGDLTGGFHHALPLTDAELTALFPLVLGRAAASAVGGALQGILEPDNRYVVDSTEISWARLAALLAVPPELAEAVSRAACGLEPHPGAAQLRRFLSPAPLVETGGRRPVPVDLGAGSEALAEGGWGTAAGLAAAAAAPPGDVAVGRWGEVRIGANPPPHTSEPATVHLGVDVFAGEGATVHAPYAGVVERCEAAELLLRHEPAGGPRFWLRLAGIAPTVLPGDTVAAGAPLGAIGPAGGILPPTCTCSSRRAARPAPRTRAPGLAGRVARAVPATRRRCSALDAAAPRRDPRTAARAPRAPSSPRPAAVLHATRPSSCAAGASTSTTPTAAPTWTASTTSPCSATAIRAWPRPPPAPVAAAQHELALPLRSDGARTPSGSRALLPAAARPRVPRVNSG